MLMTDKPNSNNMTPYSPTTIAREAGTKLAMSLCGLGLEPSKKLCEEAILTVAARMVRESGTIVALELAAKGDTSQTCSPGNESIVVAAMDALANLAKLEGGG